MEPARLPGGKVAVEGDAPGVAGGPLVLSMAPGARPRETTGGQSSASPNPKRFLTHSSVEKGTNANYYRVYYRGLSIRATKTERQSAGVSRHPVGTEPGSNTQRTRGPIVTSLPEVSGRPISPTVRLI